MTTARAAKITSREDWLNRFVQAARPVFAARGYPIPAKVRVSIGFTSNGAKGRAIGECWSDTASADGSFEIFIVPGQDDGREVAAILTREDAQQFLDTRRLRRGFRPNLAVAEVAVDTIRQLAATARHYASLPPLPARDDRQEWADRAVALEALLPLTVH